MTKIYEAMERASKERAREGDTELRPPGSPLLPPGEEFSYTLQGLYRNIEPLLPDTPHKSVQFISSADREGSSVLVREFAKIVAEKIGKKVLLLDGDLETPKQAVHFGLAGASTDSGLTIQQVGDSGLHVAELRGVSRVNTPALQDALVGVKSDFDVVLVDSPPPSRCPSSLALSARVDGVVLVIEAEKTRWQVAQHTRDSIVRQGGQILGVVLNKRHHYIPGFIYRRL